MPLVLYVLPCRSLSPRGALLCAEGVYYQCYAIVRPGNNASKLSVTKEGYGKAEALHTRLHNWDSLQRAPQWTDEPKVCPQYFVAVKI